MHESIADTGLFVLLSLLGELAFEDVKDKDDGPEEEEEDEEDEELRVKLPIRIAFASDSPHVREALSEELGIGFIGFFSFFSFSSFLFAEVSDSFLTSLDLSLMFVNESLSVFILASRGTNKGLTSASSSAADAHFKIPFNQNKYFSNLTIITSNASSLSFGSELFVPIITKSAKAICALANLRMKALDSFSGTQQFFPSSWNIHSINES